MTMSTERFNQLMNGPLDHPLIPFKITRLTLALWYVLDRTGDAGAQALEEWCQGRQQQDTEHGTS